ncbi:hypothetical protein [Granulicella paludicola]|uniref:hypothetical protein n=1 Tax=Granulicella paludicola TaxID=474951 RepID=UPI0021DF525B|nr:hypothetical protein [Granulicella paludicola]
MVEPTQPVEDERLLLLQRVVGSRTFAKSPRLARFLEFICVSLIEGRAREINEQQIGIHVFGRSAAYSASDDSIVRSQARLLRQRLEEYFETECPQSRLIVTIPKGGYVPVFEPRSEAQPVAVQTPELQSPAGQTVFSASPHGNSSAPIPSRSRASVFGFVALVSVVLVLGLLLAGLVYQRIYVQRSANAADALWSKLFTPSRPVLIVPSDDALVLFQEFTRVPVQLDDYLSDAYLTKVNLPSIGGAPLSADWFASHQYTSSADLNLALRLGRLPQAIAAEVETRNARVLRIDDLKSRNVVLIGGTGANPWVSLFQSRLNFDVKWDWKASEGFVLNKHPAKGEASIYRETVADGARRSYGVLAFLPGIEGNGEALLFEGTGMAGTESAADFPFSKVAFQNFARSIGATKDHMPYFEVLLETSSVGGNAPESTVITYRRIQP